VNIDNEQSEGLRRKGTITIKLNGESILYKGKGREFEGNSVSNKNNMC
jgi:hypothetical protein